MIKKYSYIILFAVLVALFASCNGGSGKRMPPLNETYSKTDKNPFGGYIFYHQLDNMFNRNTIRDKVQSFDKTWNSMHDTAALYVCLSEAVWLNEVEIKAMLDYVYEGNSLFIAANSIDENLLKEIGCELEDPGAFDGTYSYNGFDSMRTTHTLFRDTAYDYFYYPFKKYFTYKDKNFIRTLGLNEAGKPDYIVYFHGKGKLFLHCEPRAFGNYFLLKKENYRYVQDALAYTSGNPDRIYWDNYYRKLLYRRSTDDAGFSSLKEINKHPPLVWAFWLSLLLLALYILFGGKRRQRIIGKIKPNENTTVAFTETIGLLYLQHKDNKNIAEKMATYFNEHVRNNYFLNTKQVNDDFIDTLSRKSGVDRNQVETLYRAISHAQNADKLDDYQLLSLNEQIQKFYKKK